MMTSSAQKERNRREAKGKEKEMGESAEGYRKRVRKREEDAATARRCLATLGAMDEEELQRFYIRLGAEGYGPEDLIRFRLEHITQEIPILPPEEVREEDYLEDIDD